MKTCFVIQPFDKGAFDKRFDEILTPAIKASGLDAYRVDRDPSASIPIESIEEGIKDATLCLADVSTDNPNVWFELGYAIAREKDIVLICSEGRTTKYPFDIQHRHVISYSMQSKSDFEKLDADITSRINALLSKQGQMVKLSAMPSPIKASEGLATHEIVALAVVMQNRSAPGSCIEPNEIRRDMLRAGYAEIAVSLGLEGLLRKGMITTVKWEDDSCNSYIVYEITSNGIDWLMQNQDKLSLQKQAKEEEIPF